MAIAGRLLTAKASGSEFGRSGQASHRVPQVPARGVGRLDGGS